VEEGMTYIDIDGISHVFLECSRLFGSS